MASNNKDIEANQGKGFIVLYRSLLDWEYIDDDAVFSCFIKLIMAVNYQDKKWHNQTVKRGSIIGSIETLSSKLKISKKVLRRCLKLLSECGAITVEVVPNQYHIITVNKYSEYQNINDRVVPKRNNRGNNAGNNSGNNVGNNRGNTTKQINKGVCLTDTHTPKEEKQAALPSAPQECGTDEPQKKETPPLTEGEFRKYCESKGKDAYYAANLWLEHNGVFSEKNKKKVREWLKANEIK